MNLSRSSSPIVWAATRPAAATLLLAAAFFTGCGPRSEPETVSPQLSVVEVRVAPARPSIEPVTQEVVGTVRSKQRAQIEARVAGRIAELRVTAGQMVQEGELLARLEAVEIQARLDQAIAQEAQAARDLERFSRLVDQGAVTRQEFDAAQSRARTTAAAVTEARTMLGYLEITAPFAGVITRKLADTGDQAAPGKPLLELEDPTALRLEADVSEALIQKLELAQELAVRLAHLPGPLTGRISEIAPAADAASRTFLVKLDLPSTPGLRAGQFGRVAVPVAGTGSLLVPADALIRRGQLDYVFVVEESTARLRLVRTGGANGGQVEVLAGLDPDEVVVISNLGQLRDGQPVRLVP